MDLRGRRCRARLVVDDDPPRAVRIDVDAVDLAADRHARRELVVLERDLELARHERRARRRLGPHELLEVALQALPELAALQVVGIDAKTRIERALRRSGA